MKVVCDTNVFISAIVFGGYPREIIKAAVDGEFKLYISPSIIWEITRVLREKFKYTDMDLEQIINTVVSTCIVVEPKAKVNIIDLDPTDNKILECAQESQANYIVSGDKKHLLILKNFHKIPIMLPTDFVQNILHPSD